jgi:hypothetical protein
MRQDQYERLQALEETLLDVFLDEASPDNWPGRGLKIGEMDAQTRGDLYWVRKTAASAGMLYTRVGAMIGASQGLGVTTPGAPAEGDADSEACQLDAEVAKAEKEAARLMRELQNGTAKKAFDRKVHGR